MNDFASQSSRWSGGQQLKQQLETPVRSSPSNDRFGSNSEQQQPPQQFMSTYSSSVSSALAGIEHQLVVLRQENDMLQQQLSQSESLRRREEETHRHVQMQLQEQLHASIKTLTSRFAHEKSDLQRAAGQSQQELADLLSQYRDRLSQTVEQAAALQHRVVDLEAALDHAASQARSAELDSANARARAAHVEQGNDARVHQLQQQLHEAQRLLTDADARAADCAADARTLKEANDHLSDKLRDEAADRRRADADKLKLAEVVRSLMITNEQLMSRDSRSAPSLPSPPDRAGRSHSPHYLTSTFSASEHARQVASSAASARRVSTASGRSSSRGRSDAPVELQLMRDGLEEELRLLKRQYNEIASHLSQVGSSGAQQSSSPLFDPAALSLALTNVVDKLHRKNKQFVLLEKLQGELKDRRDGRGSSRY